ncbi:hypothetical protein N7462_006913 [Penicillium macrosclerotiorum]|uniref:uncharacterized protein n=1 Tax=Penicillium macrosclerotiorum TaxID=303699 RepID=UPI00254875CE|nr:uncharacterized protein N7462_006913 [Penicillium macrosclerotiorum]KAJ5678669.1 hypothetical protein N7462_006913 [Penicillium macrosclerotiorum]
MTAKAENRLTFQEIDNAGHPAVTYVYSEQDAYSKQTVGRVDILNPPSSALSWSTKPLINYLSDVFLPTGYPQSVSDDYLPYQLFDSLQAFCSSIAGLLSSRAVLQGVGVGNADASPTSALLLHILQDSSGRVATILFAHRVGTALEPECKTYRLAADVFNDFAMILDCLSPMVPAGMMRVSVLSTAGVLRALCGVAGGSSKASLSAHFAKWGNLAELNAKDSSQETVISLLGMLAGSVVVSHVTSFTTTWLALLILLSSHLALNYAAVRAVQMTSLNRQRANLVLSTLLATDPAIKPQTLALPSSPAPTSTHTPQPPWKVLSPAETAQYEHIFPRADALHWSYPGTTHQHLGTASIGATLATFIQHARAAQTPLPALHSLFASEAHLLVLSWQRDRWHATILLKKGCSVRGQLKGWTHALLAARVLGELRGETLDGDAMVGVLRRTLEVLNAGAWFERAVVALEENGWAVDIAALETGRGVRVLC